MDVKVKSVSILITIIIFSLAGCNNNKSKNYFIAPVNNNRNVIYDSIKLDTISFQSIESSYIGFIRIVSNSIYFIDKRFGWIFEFDDKGGLQNRYLGIGNGPSELNTSIIDGYEYLSDGRHIFIGAGNDCHIFKRNFIKEKSYIMEKRFKRANLNKNEYSPDMPEIYTLSYEKLTIRNHGNSLFFSVISEHPAFNFIRTPKKYFKDCRVIAQMNLSDGEITNMLGRYSPVYMDNPSFKQISLTSFDISKKGEFYVQQEADSLIYIYDQNYVIKESFGFQGKNMKMPTKVLANIDDFQRYYKEERQKNGFYNWVELIDETGVLFRSYKKSEDSSFDGLQIYKNKTLIADVEVPKGFKVVGYIPPFYYSNEYIDEENEKINIYKFKL